MYTPKTDQITCWLIFSALLLTTMNTSIFSNEDTPESETHITKENDQSYLTSMLNMLGSLTKKVTKTISPSSSVINKLLMLLLVAASRAAAENCATTIELNPHGLPTCHLIDQPSVERYTRVLHRFALFTVAGCKTDESNDCVDVCSSHGENILFNLLGWEGGPYALDPDFLPKESNFAICPYNVTRFEQGLTNGQEPTCSDPLETLGQHANITDIKFLRNHLFDSLPDFAKNHIGVVYKEPNCRGELPHQKIRYTMEKLENCIAKGPYPHRRKEIDGKRVIEIIDSTSESRSIGCLVRIMEAEGTQTNEMYFQE